MPRAALLDADYYFRAISPLYRRASKSLSPFYATPFHFYRVPTYDAADGERLITASAVNTPISRPISPRRRCARGALILGVAVFRRVRLVRWLLRDRSDDVRLLSA